MRTYGNDGQPRLCAPSAHGETLSRTTQCRGRPRTVGIVSDRFPPARILVVEDDEVIAMGLARALEIAGYHTERASTGAAALDRTSTLPAIDLVLLDLGLPDIDGIAVCRQMHDVLPKLPIVMLTARRDEVDVVAGLDAGALDYVAKPFRLAELLARVAAQLRRPTNDSTSSRDWELRSGDVTIDVKSRRVWVNGIELSLRAREFDLLAVLIANQGQVVTRERLMAEVWDEQWFGSTRTLDVHVSALRRRLGETDETSEVASRITNLRAVGYRFDARRSDR